MVSHETCLLKKIGTGAPAWIDQGLFLYGLCLHEVIQHNSCLEQVVYVGAAIQCRVLQDIPNSDQANDLHDGGAFR